MFPKISYLLVEKEDDEAVFAVGTFFKSGIADAKEEYDMPDAEIMEEGRFKEAYPGLYKRMFIDTWYNFMYTILNALPFINFEAEIQYDEYNTIYYNDWFKLWHDIESDALIIESSVYANTAKINNLITAIIEYCKGLMEVKIVEPQYVSLIDQKTYFGKVAIQKMLAEPVILYFPKN